ncbi:efflux RND transporter periplasmic adaptor subunit [Ramlibacter sp.]|uniref:efflux RND transporter periplasmic adaptor subunit n=1 Tax=Ramlibacter sp. TaxID=1917967 RepID=UPI002C08503A|nr:efflux RND transporter periplasmic adaptor subunit [Ramlibacter sp.]HWI82392.1 efflux RND transporter periplasmic adaptor subunit [Ramlibacter sp.]
MKQRWPWILLSAVLLAALAFAGYSMRGTAIEVVEVQPKPLLRTLRFSARVATLSRVDVGATVTGRVAQVLVDEGVQVRRGQPLIRLESEELRAALAQSVAAERQAQARLAGLRTTGRHAALAALEQAQATLRAAQAELARQQQLVAQGFVSASRIDEARRAADVARAQQDNARAQVQAIADGGTDVAQAQAQLALARAATTAARARLEQAVVVAPADARVLLRQVEPGQIVQPGKALMSLALAGPTQLVAPVDERFLEQLQVGQSALVVADAFAGQPFAARVLSIAPAVDPQRGAIEVKLALTAQPPAFLREDMTLSVDVETGRRDRALVVPLGALRPAAGEQPATLLVVRDGRTQERQVRLGLRTLDAVEVSEGLAAGERVALRGQLPPGERVRATVVAWQPGQQASSSTHEDVGSTLGNAFGR